MTSSHKPGPGGSPPVASAPDAWQATRAQTSMATQFFQDKDDYLAPDAHGIGRLTSANERELFVSCAPAEALQQQFEHLRSEFIAIHDIGCSASRKLLAAIATAASRSVQKLTIRRQGFGTALASIEFVELLANDGSVMRLYSTVADADTASRQGLARMLLAFSRLGVVMVGDLPGHAIASSLSPLHEHMVTGPWPNRQMLLLPLTASGALTTQGVELAQGTRVNVRTTPQVKRLADAWGYINGTWARVRDPALAPTANPPAHAPGADRGDLSAMSLVEHPSVATPAPPPPVRPPPNPLLMRPMPAVPSPGVSPAAHKGLLDRYVQRLSELVGMVSCCVFDVASGLEVSHAGASPGANDLAFHGSALLAAMTATSRTLGMGHLLPEAAITLGSHHLLLRAVPRHPGLALHAVLDKTHANLTLARLQVARMDALFDDLPPT